MAADNARDSMKEGARIEEVLKAQALDGKPLRVTIGESWMSSRVEVGGVLLPCVSVDLEVEAGDHSMITLRIASSRLSEPIVVEGILHITDIEIEEEDE